MDHDLVDDAVEGGIPHGVRDLESPRQPPIPFPPPLLPLPPGAGIEGMTHRRCRAPMASILATAAPSAWGPPSRELETGGRMKEGRGWSGQGVPDDDGDVVAKVGRVTEDGVALARPLAPEHFLRGPWLMDGRR